MIDRSIARVLALLLLVFPACVADFGLARALAQVDPQRGGTPDPRQPDSLQRRNGASGDPADGAPLAPTPAGALDSTQPSLVDPSNGDRQLVDAWQSRVDQVLSVWAPRDGGAPLVVAIGVRYGRTARDNPAAAAAETAEPRAPQPDELGVPAIDGPNELTPGGPASRRPDHWTLGIVLAPGRRIVTTYHGLGLPWPPDMARRMELEAWAGGRGPTPVSLTAADPWSDLAVLSWENPATAGADSVEAATEPGMKLGAELTEEPAANLAAGQFVIVLGNPAALVQSGVPTAGWGWIANVNRGPADLTVAGSANSSEIDIENEPVRGYASRYELGQLLELDVRVADACSGAPVLDLDGRLIGIVTSSAIVSGHDTGAAYALPVDAGLVRVVSELSAGREVAYGFLGLRPDQTEPQAESDDRPRGVHIGQVLPGTPAYVAGLREGDVVTRLDDRPVLTPQQLEWVAASSPPGSVARLDVHRPGGLLRRSRPIRLDVKLSKKPRPVWPEPMVTTPAPVWRGMGVDYITAAVDFDRHLAALANGVVVMVTRVDPGSPADAAGVRVGMLIARVGSEAPDTPESFHRLASAHSGPVQLTLADSTTLEVK